MQLGGREQADSLGLGSMPHGSSARVPCPRGEGPAAGGAAGKTTSQGDQHPPRGRACRPGLGWTQRQGVGGHGEHPLFPRCKLPPRVHEGGGGAGRLKFEELSIRREGV